MNKDSGVPLVQLQVDGGMTANTLLLQTQSDLVGLNVCRPKMAELTALVNFNNTEIEEIVVITFNLAFVLIFRVLQWLPVTRWANGIYQRK